MRHSLAFSLSTFVLALTACGGRGLEVVPIPDASAPDTSTPVVPDAGEPDVSVPPDAGPDVFVPPDAGCGGPGLASDGFIVYDSDVQGLTVHIFAVRADGCLTVQLTSGPSGEQEPSISPDGKTLLYTGTSSGSPQIYAMDLATKAVLQVTSQSGGAREGTFSPDGSTILYSSNGSVFVVNADGTSPREVLAGPADGGYPAVFEHPAFTPDGQAIVVDGQNIINAYDLQGTYLRTIVPNWDTDELYPAVSPDGATLAFLTGCGAVATSLAVVSMAGSQDDPCSDHMLASSGGGLNRPTWGPRALVAVSYPANGGKTITVVAGANHLHELTPDGSHQMNPFWAPSTFHP